MQVKIIEATNVDAGGVNWGKFMLGRFDTEWQRRSLITESRLLSSIGWGPKHLLVLDLQTGEGAIFSPGGHASSDLNTKHQVWVCPMFEPFLNWLYGQDLSDLSKLPDLVQISDPASALSGYRRQSAA